MLRKLILLAACSLFLFPTLSGCSEGNTVIQPGEQEEMRPEEQAEYDAEQQEMEEMR